MRILVTGATGFLGNNLVRALSQQGHQIVVTLRNASNRDSLAGLEYEAIHIDLNEPSDVAMALTGVDAVVHSAALIQIGWSKLEASRRINVDATANIAAAARRKNIRMIHVSSVDALGSASETEVGDETKLNPPKPACSYVITKRESESAVILEVSNGLDAVIVNPGFMVGPYDWKPSSGEMMLAVASKPVPFAPAGGCCIADVRDVADGIISAMEHGQTGQRYILGGENMSYLDLWALMAKVTGRRPPTRSLPNWMAFIAGRGGDFAGKLVRREMQINSAATQMGQMFHYYSSEKAKRELGYNIGNIEDALRDAWDWFQLHGYTNKSR